MRAKEAQKLRAQVDEYEGMHSDCESVHEELSAHERGLAALKNKRYFKYDKVLCAAWKEAQKNVAQAEGAVYLFMDLLEQRVDAYTEKLDEADAWEK